MHDAIAHLLCPIFFLFSALPHPKLVPRYHAQDFVPSIHRQPWKQLTRVRLANKQHRQRRQPSGWWAPSMRAGRPVTEVFVAESSAVPGLCVVKHREFLESEKQVIVQRGGYPPAYLGAPPRSRSSSSCSVSNRTSAISRAVSCGLSPRSFVIDFASSGVPAATNW